VIGVAVIAAALAAEPDLARGRAVYRDACEPCHGASGRGAGPAAAELRPPPRDFVGGAFRFRSTPLGARPLLRDVERTVASGVRATWMPSFGNILPPDDLRAVSAYVLSLVPGPDAGEPVVLVPPGDTLSPAADTPALRERGRELYVRSGCAECHGPEGRGDGPAAKTLVNARRESVAPRDLTAGVLQGGASPADVYRTIFAGIDGTPMLSFAQSVPDETDRWALVHYVRSLARESGPLQWLFGPRTPWE